MKKLILISILLVLPHANAKSIFDIVELDSPQAVEASITPENVNQKDANGNTLLMIAAIRGNTEIIQKLLDKNADINAKNNRGFTPVDLAAWMKRDEAVEYLVKKGAKIGNVSPGGMTALMLAASSDSFSTVKKLIELGWKPDYENKNGLSALMISITEKHDQATIALLSKMDLEKALCKEVKEYDVKRYHTLAKKMAEKNRADPELQKLTRELQLYVVESNFKASCDKVTHKRKGFFPTGESTSASQ